MNKTVKGVMRMAKRKRKKRGNQIDASTVINLITALLNLIAIILVLIDRIG